MGLFKKKVKKEIEAKKENEKIKEGTKEGGFNSPTDFLNEFEKTREFKVASQGARNAEFDDISRTVSFSLKENDLLSEDDKLVLNLSAIEKIIGDLKVKAISVEEVQSLSMESIKKLYDQQVKAHKALLKKIPKLRIQVEEEVAVINSKVPRIKQQKIRKLRRATDKQISNIQKEINEIRIRVSVLKEQINQMARKFKSIEKQVVENKASDRSVMEVVASLSDENSDAIKANLDNFSDSELTEKSRSMYNGVLLAIRKVIGEIKAEIDKITTQEEEKISEIKELEFGFQISSGRHSSITKDLKFAIKKEHESTEKLFEWMLNVSSENVSILQREYNKLLIDAEEQSFEIKMEQMVKSIESTKMGLNFSKEISEIESEVSGINDSHLDQEGIQEMTKEVEIMVKGESRASKVKVKKLNKPNN